MELYGLGVYISTGMVPRLVVDSESRKIMDEIQVNIGYVSLPRERLGRGVFRAQRAGVVGL